MAASDVIETFFFKTKIKTKNQMFKTKTKIFTFVLEAPRDCKTLVSRTTSMTTARGACSNTQKQFS